MFCIFNDTLHIADPGLSYSHAVWFEKNGWMTPEDDSLMNCMVRGFVSDDGDVYFFVGYDFQANKEIANEFFKYLPELVEKLKIKPTANVYGGLIKQITGGQWPARKRYGSVGEILNS